VQPKDFYVVAKFCFAGSGLFFGAIAAARARDAVVTGEAEAERPVNGVLDADARADVKLGVRIEDGGSLIEDLQRRVFAGEVEPVVLRAREAERERVFQATVAAAYEHGRGLKIIDAVVDNMQLTGSKSEGTILHFDKALKWLPGAAGQHLLGTDGGSKTQPG